MNFIQLISRSERETLKFRLLALLTVSVAMLFQARSVPLLSTLALVGGYLVYSYVLRAFLIPRYLGYLLALFMLLADAVALLAALYILGISSPAFALLPIAVVYHSIYLGYAGGLTMATVSTLGYTGLAFLTGQASQLGNVLAVQVPLFYVLAFLAGYVAQQRLREVEERRSLQQLIDVETNARLLLDLTQALRRSQDVEGLSRGVVQMASLTARMPICLLFFFDEESKALVCRSATTDLSTLGKDGSHGFTERPDSPSFVAQAWRTGTPTLFYQEGTQTPTGLLPAWLTSQRLTRGIAVPLSKEAASLGVLCLMDDHPEPLPQETVELLQAFAGVAANILSAVRSYEDAERRSKRLVRELQHTIDTTGRLRDQTRKRPLRFGSLILDPAKEIVRSQDQIVRLTRTEFDLLYVLAQNPGAVLNQETITREVWGKDFVPQGKVVDVSIHRLRKKLSALPEGKGLIATVRGQGYSFSPPSQHTPRS
ncbi:MAG: winged helix-turn-helix domain-containing protein [Chloroflexi bacterium]|nr:winged helix-turn-helix domain-containing protein [Chloroflexota bacterium]